MYLLIACAGSWLILLGSLFAAWTQLPQPWTTSDVVVIVIIGTSVLVFARLGLVSLSALLLRVLPSGRLRSRLAGIVVQSAPRLLASSVLAIVSASLVVHSAQATPIRSGPAPASAPVTAGGPVDPGWPTVDEDSGAGDSPDTAARPDPGWPTEPPEAHAPPEPSENRQPEQSEDRDQSGQPDESDDAAADTESATHVVAPGESLWSITADLVETPADIPQFVASVYAANEDTIGPDPSLIIAGQRLEIPK